MQKNDIVTADIEDIGVNGEGIGKVDGYTLFIKSNIDVFNEPHYAFLIDTTRNQITYEPKEIVLQLCGDFFHRLPVSEIPYDRRIGIDILVDFKKDLENRDNQRKREEIQNGRQDVEHDVPHQIFLIRRDKAPQYTQEIFHTK